MIKLSDLNYFVDDNEPKKLSHRQKQRASRRTKKKNERKAIKKEKKKGNTIEDDAKSNLIFVNMIILAYL